MISFSKGSDSADSPFKAGLVKWAGIFSIALCLVCLSILIVDVLEHGFSGLTYDFFTSYASRFPNRAGIKAALFGTFWVMALTLVMAVPIGIATSVYLEEFAPSNLVTRLIKMNIANLAGVPSIVYGILGLGLFVRAMSLGRSVLAAALTMSLVILPTIIITTSEALKSVPQSVRWGAYGVGATKRQAVWYHVLPEALPGILTGVILSLSRAIGESAPLIMIGALSFVAFVPSSLSDSFTVLSIQIFDWAGRPQAGFQKIAASGIIVLLAITLSMNAFSIYLRAKISKAKK